MVLKAKTRRTGKEKQAKMPKWYLIKETGSNIETYLRLDRVYQMTSRVAESYIYVTLHLDNGQEMKFTRTADQYQELKSQLEGPDG